VPSSTSNSSPPVPNKRWGLTWLLALVLTVLSLGGLEWWWRSQGLVPSVEDDMALWSYQRQRVYHNGGKTLVLAGASEMQTGFSTATFRRRFPDYRVVQLAIRGANPMPTFRDLADDDSFRGLVICALNERNVLHLDAQGAQAEYVRYYHEQSSLNTRLNRLMSAWLEDKLVILNSGLSLRSILLTYSETGHLPRPLARTMRLDRSRYVDFGQVGSEVALQQRKERIGRLELAAQAWSLSPDEWLEKAMEIETLVEKIQHRGGQVVFVHFPISDEAEVMAEKIVPRARYWDAFAKRTKAITVHCDELPALNQFYPPDLTHLDYRDAPAFTDALLNELVRLRVFEPATVANVSRQKAVASRLAIMNQ
jgi:hypothetical protein